MSSILEDQVLESLCQLAIDAALEAGEVIKGYRGEEIRSTRKGQSESLVSDIVTEVDIQCQKIIEEKLKKGSQAILQSDTIAFLGEEESDDGSRFRKNFFWLVDPIDGTLAFTKQQEGYSVSIALVSKDGSPMMGVVYDPWNDKLYHAISGKEFHVIDKKTGTVSAPPGTEQQDIETQEFVCYLDGSYSQDNARYTPLIEWLKAKVAAAGYSDFRIVTQGGAVTKACWVLDKHDLGASCYLKLPKAKGGSLWDYAATACFYQCSQCHASDIFGASFELNRPDSTYMNHKGFLFARKESLAKDILEFVQKNNLAR